MSDDAAVYRVVCERCDMRTGTMPADLAHKARDAHEASTGHETEVEADV